MNHLLDALRWFQARERDYPYGIPTRLIAANPEEGKSAPSAPSATHPAVEAGSASIESEPLPAERAARRAEVLFVVSEGGAPEGSSRHALLKGAVEKGLKLPWASASVIGLTTPFNLETILSADAEWIVVCGDDVAEATGFAAADDDEEFVTLPRGQRLIVTRGIDEVISDPTAKRVFWNSLKSILAGRAED